MVACNAKCNTLGIIKNCKEIQVFILYQLEYLQQNTKTKNGEALERLSNIFSSEFILTPQFV